MKKLKYLLLLTIVACSSPKVVYDYDSKMNFNQYKTFDFFEDAGKGLNELDLKRITAEISQNLNKKGLRHSNTPDFYINILSKTREVQSRNTVGIGVGGGRRNVGFGISGGIPISSKKLNQQLTIDFVESKENQLIWQAILESEINEQTSPQERDVHYKKIIGKILAGYPPKK
ncbi:uncharacterized protein DUF4136 [Tenacibaculum adriaticum]|uniref:Uncharacterized protein DUF4136 n=1 Tax=Tenacibaculum adriaticum TaxID=413713 RepID=A0A5S5DSZ8_9FLAO|nr:DUF4136 domain-containing protein [Tenacibaculum adriaticum]TYP97992.1 uncharacterized protein DUF4136 [Tenacibaculum adriaticum]